jgi:hypothetical protein
MNDEAMKPHCVEEKRGQEKAENLIPLKLNN